MTISYRSCLIYGRAVGALLEYVIVIVWVRSVNKMLPSVKFAEDTVLTFLILSEKNAKIFNSISLTLILTLFPGQIDKINRSGIVERYIVVK